MTLSEARRIDKLLYELAFYEITEGKMPAALNHESAIKLGTKANLKFNEFKNLVQSGEFTVGELERDIVRRNAAVPKKSIPTIDNLDDFVREYDKNEKLLDEEALKNEKLLDEEALKSADLIGNFVNTLLKGKGLDLLTVPDSAKGPHDYSDYDDFGDYDEPYDEPDDFDEESDDFDEESDDFDR